MKKILFFLFIFFLTGNLFGQVSKTISIKAGGLSTALNIDEKNAVTDLKIIGTIDARDFLIMRDSLNSLNALDLSESTIKSYSGKKGTNCVQEIISSYEKNTIPKYAFYDEINERSNLSLQSIILSPTTQYIDEYAFKNCLKLKTISIPPSVCYIGKHAFEGCIGIEELAIPEGIDIIEDFVFNNCTNLKSIIIPNSISFIGTASFQGCTNLEKIDIPQKVKSLMGNPFFGCSAIINVDPGNEKYSSLNGILFDKRMELLIHCPLSNKITCNIPKSTKDISTYAFFGEMHGYINVDEENPFFSSLNGVLFNKDKSILILAPINAQGNFIIDSSVKKITSLAFIYCKNLNSIFIPSSTNYIDASAFSLCNALIEVDSMNTNYSSKEGVLYNRDYTKLIYFPAKKTGVFTIPNSVLEIESCAIQNCDSLTILNIPRSVLKINDNAIHYNNCVYNVDEHNPNYYSINGILFERIKESLISCPTSLSGTYCIPNSVKIIKSGAFGNCSKLSSILIPASVNLIELSAFNGCKSLSSIYSYSRIPPLVRSYNFYDNFDSNLRQRCFLHVPVGSKEKYYNTTEWGYIKNIIDDL
jgi:hypothetical protein